MSDRHEEIECYECGRLKTRLIWNSLCVTCTLQKLEANLEENDSLRGQIATLKEEIKSLREQIKPSVGLIEDIAAYVESLENPKDARAIRAMAAENIALKEENERLNAEKVQINGKLAGSRLAVSRLEERVAELEAKIENILFKFQHWTIIRNSEPVPLGCDVGWDFVHAEYDGENGLAGTGKDPTDCLRQIVELVRGTSQ